VHRSHEECTDGAGYNYCDTPLRGGTTIHYQIDPENYDECTTGFYVASKADLKDYMLSAGHCSPAGRHWLAGLTSADYVPLGYTHHSIFINRGPDDEQIITIDSPNFWQPRRYVVVYR